MWSRFGSEQQRQRGIATAKAEVDEIADKAEDRSRRMNLVSFIRIVSIVTSAEGLDP